MSPNTTPTCFWTIPDDAVGFSFLNGIRIKEDLLEDHTRQLLHLYGLLRTQDFTMKGAYYKVILKQNLQI